MIGKANVLPSADSIHHPLTEKVQTSTSSICLLTFLAKISQQCFSPPLLHIFACQGQSSHERHRSLTRDMEFCCEQIHWKGHQEISASDKYSCLLDEYNHWLRLKYTFSAGNYPAACSRTPNSLGSSSALSQSPSLDGFCPLRGEKEEVV